MKKRFSLNSDNFITLNDDELAPLKKLQQEIVNTKIALANTTIQFTKTEENIRVMVDKLIVMEDNYVNEAKEVAKAHGIDVDKPDQGQWNLDIDNKTLKKTN